MVLVKAEISGHLGSIVAHLALDTGATVTILNTELLRGLGYQPEASADLARLTAGIGATTARRMMIIRITSLGHHAIGLRVLAHDLPPEAGVDGLLGLDFFRDLALTIDFRSGRITVS